MRRVFENGGTRSVASVGFCKSFTYKHKGRSMGLHVPESMEADARRATADYRKLKKLVQKISDFNLKKLRRRIAVMKAKSRQRLKSYA